MCICEIIDWDCVHRCWDSSTRKFHQLISLFDWESLELVTSQQSPLLPHAATLLLLPLEMSPHWPEPRVWLSAEVLFHPVPFNHCSKRGTCAVVHKARLSCDQVPPLMSLLENTSFPRLNSHRSGIKLWEWDDRWRYYFAKHVSLLVVSLSFPHFQTDSWLWSYSHRALCVLEDGRRESLCQKRLVRLSGFCFLKV